MVMVLSQQSSSSEPACGEVLEAVVEEGLVGVMLVAPQQVLDVQQEEVASGQVEG